MNYGDSDCVVGEYSGDGTGASSTCCCYTQVQYASLDLARQSQHRYRPDIVLIDLQHSVTAELVSVLACMRLGIPFCPVDTLQQHAGGKRLQTLVDTLKAGVSGNSKSNSNSHSTRIAAIVLAKDDTDPFLRPFIAAGVHNLIYINENGDLLEPMQVPDRLPSRKITDDLYILFTSGTSGNTPKAVVGSHKSTMNRLKWFHEEFQSDAFNTTILARRTPLTFVDGVNELLNVCLAPIQLYPIDPSQGLGSILDSVCTRVTMLPSQLAQLLLVVPKEDQGAAESTSTKSTSTLELLVISGEPCSVSLLEDYQNCEYFSNTHLLNLYGQTETTGDC
jgi:acyl-coenzyme A synthetase/AMP-(fatty) acid ligase